MALNNSPLNYTSIDLELEAIQRFRTLAPFLPRACRVSRELDGSSTSLMGLEFQPSPMHS